jgi:hypothetical protein
MKNFNKHIRLFSAAYIPILVFIIVQINSRQMSWDGLVLGLFILFLNIFIFSLSFIKKSEVLNWVYAILFFLLFSYVIYLLFTSIDRDGFYHCKTEVAFVFLSFGISLVLSFILSSYLTNKKKEISLWSLAFNFAMLFWIIYQCVLI